MSDMEMSDTHAQTGCLSHVIIIDACHNCMSDVLQIDLRYVLDTLSLTYPRNIYIYTLNIYIRSICKIDIISNMLG